MERKTNNKYWACEYGLQQEQKTVSPICNKYNQFQKQLPSNIFKEPMLMNYASSILQTGLQDSKFNQQIVYEVSDVVYPHSQDIQTYNQLINKKIIKQNAKTSNQKIYFRQNIQEKLEKMVNNIQKIKSEIEMQNQLAFMRILHLNFRTNNFIKQPFYQKKKQNSSKTSFFTDKYYESDYKIQIKQQKELSENMRKCLQQLSGLLVFKVLMIQSQTFSIILNYKPKNLVYQSKNMKNAIKNIQKINDSKSSTISSKTSNANILETIHFLKEKSKIRQHIQQNCHKAIKIQDYEDNYSTPHTKKNIYFNQTTKKKKKQLSQTETMNTKKNSEIRSQYESNSLHTYQKYQQKQFWDQNQLPTIKNIHRISVQNNIIKIQPIIIQPEQQKRRYLAIRTNLYEFPLNSNLKQSKFLENGNNHKLYKQSQDIFGQAQFDITSEFKPIEIKPQIFLKKKQRQKYSNKVVQYQSDLKLLQRTQKKQKQKIQKYYFQQEKPYPLTQKKKLSINPFLQRQNDKKNIETEREGLNKQTEKFQIYNLQLEETRKSKLLFTGKKWPNLHKDSFIQVYKNDSKLSNKSNERKVNSMPKVIFNTLRPNSFIKPVSILKPNNQIGSRVENNQQYRINQFQIGAHNLSSNSKSLNTHYFSQKNIHQQNYIHHQKLLNTQNRTPQKMMTINRNSNNVQIGPSSPKVQYYSRPLSPYQNNLINKFFDNNQNYNYSTLQHNNQLPIKQNKILQPSSNKNISPNQLKWGQEFSNNHLNYLNRNKIMSQIPKNNLFFANDSQLSRPDSNVIPLQSKNSQISQTQNEQFIKNPKISRPKSMSAKIFVTLRNQKTN